MIRCASRHGNGAVPARSRASIGRGRRVERGLRAFRPCACRTPLHNARLSQAAVGLLDRRRLRSDKTPIFGGAAIVGADPKVRDGPQADPVGSAPSQANTLPRRRIVEGARP